MILTRLRRVLQRAALDEISLRRPKYVAFGKIEGVGFKDARPTRIWEDVDEVAYGLICSTFVHVFFLEQIANQSLDEFIYAKGVGNLLYNPPDLDVDRRSMHVTPEQVFCAACADPLPATTIADDLRDAVIGYLLALEANG
jgi:hypothetical protein